MKGYQTEIPVGSIVRRYLPADYADAFSCETKADKKLLADEVMIVFWTATPGWVNILFKLRNALVRPFGLETGDKLSDAMKEMIRTGSGSAGWISVAAKSENETVVLLSDQHLDAYLSVCIAGNNDTQTATAVTLVHYRNRWGKAYFFFVRPFHKIVVKNRLNHTLRRLLK